MRLKLSIQPLVGLLAGGRVLGNTVHSGSSHWSPPPPTNPNMESSSFNNGAQDGAVTMKPTSRLQNRFLQTNGWHCNDSTLIFIYSQCLGRRRFCFKFSLFFRHTCPALVRTNLLYRNASNSLTRHQALPVMFFCFFFSSLGLSHTCQTDNELVSRCCREQTYCVQPSTTTTTIILTGLLPLSSEQMLRKLIWIFSTSYV